MLFWACGLLFNTCDHSLTEWCLANRTFLVFMNEWMFNLDCLGTAVISKLCGCSYKIIGFITRLHQSESSFFNKHWVFPVLLKNAKNGRVMVEDNDKGILKYKIRSLQLTSNHHHLGIYFPKISFSYTCHVHSPCILPYSTCDSLSPIQSPTACLLSSLSYVPSEKTLEKTFCKTLIYSYTFCPTFSPLSAPWFLALFWWVALLSTFSTGTFPTHSKSPGTFCLRLAY